MAQSHPVNGVSPARAFLDRLVPTIAMMSVRRRFVSLEAEIVARLRAAAWPRLLALAAYLAALVPSVAVSQDSIVLDDDFLLITKDNGLPPKGDSPRGSTAPSDPHAQSATEPRHIGLCERYTYEAGWKRPMELYLGEGAREYLPVIRHAVKVWNDLAPGLIDLKEDLVNYPYLGEPYIGLDKYNDGVSVIYFPEELDLRGGFAIARRDLSDEPGATSEISESDVFVWAQNKIEVNFGSTTVHELGHALGLGHIPVSGNVMSYSALETRVPDRIHILFSLGAFPKYGTNPSSSYLSYFLGVDPQYRDLVFHQLVRPHAMDRSVFSCLYSDWSPR